MKLFDVYPIYPIEPVRGQGTYVWDTNGTQYLDLYGGHAVISIGHSHPHYIGRMQEQLNKIGFYSNSVKISIQEELAEKLGALSGYTEHALFLCNSGAEANENALRVASFHTGRKNVIVFGRGFHGRTSLALEATDNATIQAPVNFTGNIIRLPLNDIEALKSAMNDTIAAVLIEGIQGISGIYEPTQAFLQEARTQCDRVGAALILDEIQSGYGRTGKFFAHQHAGIVADIICIAKGMGNGFPIGGILIAPAFKAKHGMLGTTFGGNHLACAAGLAVLEVIEKENLMQNAKQVGEYLLSKLKEIPAIKEVRGKGLMVGIELEKEAKPVRSRLVFEEHIFTGSADHPNVLRILPALSLSTSEADRFVSSLTTSLA